MRRIENLHSPIYEKKYRKIYELIYAADLDTIKDFSNWKKLEQDIVTRATPLWIICESTILNKRIWIMQEFGDFKISTAALNLDVKTEKYNNSFVHKYFKNQNEMVEALELLLKPCLEEGEMNKYEKCS